MDIITSARIPEDLHERLRKEAYEKKISQNDIIIMALSAYFGIEDTLKQAKK